MAATPVPKPGRSEQGFLADLKETAEQVGKEVLGEPVQWAVEDTTTGTLKRPDVVIRRDGTGEVIASGEAKRPDMPKGEHPLVASELQDAVRKARMVGAPIAFNTNFFQAAMLDPTGPGPDDFSRVRGDLFTVVPQSLATAPDWWLALTNEERSDATANGLRRLFEHIRAAHAATAETRPVDTLILDFFSRVTDMIIGPLHHHFLVQRDNGQLDVALHQHALRAELNLNNDLEARYLVAQGVAEVLSAALFHRTMRSAFALGELLAGQDPRSNSTLRKRLDRSLDDARVVTGDYDTIFELSPSASWSVANGGKPVLERWKELLSFVELLDVEQLESDVIGGIFERLISPERRRAMGQHYTQTRIARSMSRWAVRDATDTVADVACGAGTFLIAAYAILRDRGRTHKELLRQVLGNDIDPFAVHLATINLATRDIYKGANYPAVRLGDAFDIRPDQPLVEVSPPNDGHYQIDFPQPGADAIIGNPPYYAAPDDLDRFVVALTQLAGNSAAPTGLRGGNLAAWFGLLASALLRKGGRFALVMPTGVLQNDNLTVWRTWLRENFDVVVWHTEEDVWFSDARVATCVILAEPSARNSPTLKFAEVADRVEGALDYEQGVPIPARCSRIVDLSHTSTESDILVNALYPSELVRFRDAAATCEIGDLDGVTVAYGNKLGHSAFQLKDYNPDSKAVLRDISGHQMEVRLNRKYLLPLLAGPKDERTGEFRRTDQWVLNAPEKLPPSGALREYIDHLEALGVNNAPSVRGRGPAWWHGRWKASQIALQLHPGFLHQVWWRAEPFVAKNNFHIVQFSEHWDDVENRELVAASLASAFGALSALYISDEVGCEGVRYLTTRQLRQWPVFDPRRVARADVRRRVLEAYRHYRTLEAQELHQLDQQAIEALTDLTDAVAEAAGVDQPTHVARDAVEQARRTCIRREGRERLALAGRQTKGRGSGNTTRKTVRATLAQSRKAAELLDALTSGDEVVRLRSHGELAQGTLDLDGTGETDPTGEMALTNVLGEGFRCAPYYPGDDPEQTARLARQVLRSLHEELLPPRPDDDNDASVTYEAMREEVDREATSWLQRKVKEALS